MYITPPPGVKAKDIDCKITTTHLKLGIKGNPPFIDVSFCLLMCDSIEEESETVGSSFSSRFII